ncbi:hypothetical protein PGQ11_005872 [Apiospora arundinis]|uniref:Uncharacterized protein n=1 Tax=Apiospora arundinis TaxID=335852 RepID=A0ABR2IRS0_9PEZI
MMLPLAIWLLSLACSQIHGAWAISPSRTTPFVPINAINPTVSGEIGINPIDILPPTSVVAPIGTDTQYLTEIVTDNLTVTKWIAATTDFGTATINITTNGQVQETTIPQGFQVTNNSAGVVEIAFSPYIKTFLDDILPKLPPCNPLLLRAEASTSTANAQTERRPRLLQPRIDPAAACARTRAGRFSQLAAEDEAFVQQLNDLHGQVVRVTGNDAAALAESGEAMAFGLEEGAIAEVVEVEMALSSEIVALMATAGLAILFDILASAAFAYGIYMIAEGLWKLFAHPEPKPIFTPTRTYEVTQAPSSVTTPSLCPTSPVPCIGNRCQGSADTTCSNEWKDCPCDVTGISIGDPGFWGGSTMAWAGMLAWWHTPRPNRAVCLSNLEGDELTMEDDPWNAMFSEFCDAVGARDPKDIEDSWSYCASFDGQRSIQFEFEYNGTNPGDCKIQCHDAYDELQSQCNYNSHTKYREGYTENSCGAAFYTVLDDQCM